MVAGMPEQIGIQCVRQQFVQRFSVRLRQGTNRFRPEPHAAGVHYSVEETLQMQCGELAHDGLPMQTVVLVLYIQRNIQIHPQSRTTAVQVLGQVTDRVDKVKIILRTEPKPVVRHGMYPRGIKICL